MGSLPIAANEAVSHMCDAGHLRVTMRSGPDTYQYNKANTVWTVLTSKHKAAGWVGGWVGGWAGE